MQSVHKLPPTDSTPHLHTRRTAPHRAIFLSHTMSAQAERDAFLARGSNTTPRRARAHGAAALGLASDAPEEEAYELTHDDEPAAPQENPPSYLIHAGFDPLTPREHGWMLASVAVVAALTGLGLYLCFVP